MGGFVSRDGTNFSNQFNIQKIGFGDIGNNPQNFVLFKEKKEQ